MKTQQWRDLTPEEIEDRVKALKKELFDLRMQRAAGKLTKPHQMRRVRRDAARGLTILKQSRSKPANSGREG